MEQERELKMVLLDVKAQTIKPVLVKDKLEEFYKLLNCDVIDIAVRKVGGKYFDIICDEEGPLKADPVISGVHLGEDEKVEPMLCGNLLFCHHDDEGYQTSLGDGDELLLRKNACVVADDNGKVFLVVDMDY